MTPDEQPLRIGFVTRGDKRQVAELEALHVDSLWVGGHVASRNPTGEAIVALARLSAWAERAEIGTSILLLPLYPPAVVAKQLADIDRATGGRLLVGVGVGGEYPQEFRACGVPIEERGRRTDEIIPLLRRMWTAEAIDHPGPAYQMHDVRIHPAPVRAGGPPLLVAGRQEVAMRRSARLGDGWMPYLYSPRRYAASVEVVRATAAAAGRDLGAFEWLAFVFVNVNPDGDVARAEAAATLGGTYDQDFGPMVDAVAAAGTVDDVTTKLKAFVDAGVRHFIFSPAVGRGDAGAMARRLMHEVIPAVRAHHAAGVRS